jgi:HlyD family secretion protein
MVEDRKQSSRLWLWLGAAVLVVIVFFWARSLTRERLPVREARVSRQQVVNQISTNGRVEPVVNYPIYSPTASTVKALYVQQGDQVPAGKVLLQLDDLQARARVASAESGVKTAQAALDAATHNGSGAGAAGCGCRSGARQDRSRPGQARPGCADPAEGQPGRLRPAK